MRGRLRILALSDVHGRLEALEKAVRDVRRRGLEFDVVVAAGDLGNPQRPSSFSLALEKLTELGAPVYYVRGNWDVNISGEIPKDTYDLDEVGPVDLGRGYVLVGHGRSAKPYDAPSGRKVLVTHYPPFGILDRGRKLEAPTNAIHSGLVQVNYLVSHYKPLVHIFGHSHSLGGIDMELGGVRYVNVARLDRVTKSGSHIGNYCLLTLGGDKARVEWYYLGGALKVCSNCGRRVHLPVNWRICRKCARRKELRTEPLPPEFKRIAVKVSEYHASGFREILSNELEIPLETIKDREVLAEFLEIVLVRELRKSLSRFHEKVFEVPKEKIIEVYGEGREYALIPFSEYLFSCDEALCGKRLCTLMRLYSLDKRVHVVWGLGGGSKTWRVEREYVLFSRDLLAEAGSDVLSALLREGFAPLVFEIAAAKSERGSIEHQGKELYAR